MVLEAEARDLSAALADAGLGPALVPEPSRDDLLAWSEALGATRRSWTELAACLSEIAAIEGRPIRAPFSNRRVTSWQQARDLARAGLSRAEAEQRRLAARLESAVARAHRLGAPAAVASSHVPSDGSVPSTDTTLVLLRERVERAEADVERLRAVRLREVSHAARNAYAAIRGHDARALPPAVGALVSLGLVVAIEDAS